MTRCGKPSSLTGAAALPDRSSAICTMRKNQGAAILPSTTAPSRDVVDRNGDGLLLSDQHNESLPSGDAGVEEIALQHGIMLSEYRDNHGGIF